MSDKEEAIRVLREEERNLRLLRLQCEVVLLQTALLKRDMDAARQASKAFLDHALGHLGKDGKGTLQ